MLTSSFLASVKPKNVALVSGFLLLVLGIYLYRLWQPDRQIRLHQEHFIHAAETRNSGQFGSLIDEGYTDRWHHTKAEVVRDAREVLGQFFTLTIRQQIVNTDQHGETATVQSIITLEGDGTPIAQMAKEAVNVLPGPFTFEWKHVSWLPWDWKLTRCDQPQLNVPGNVSLY